MQRYLHIDHSLGVQTFSITSAMLKDETLKYTIVALLSVLENERTVELVHKLIYATNRKEHAFRPAICTEK